jgi:cysteinyl-tRNA synthetase
MAEQLQNTGNRNPLKGLFNYQWIVKNIPFFLYLSALTVLYIANGHRADTTIRRINATTNELKELQFAYKTLKSEVMFKSEEVQIVKATEPLGLKVSKEMPKRLQEEKKN